MALHDPMHHSLFAQFEALNQQQSELARRLTEMHEEQREMRRVLAIIVHRLMDQQILEGSEEEVEQFLAAYQPSGEGAKSAAARMANEVIGKVRCQCGAVINDIKGITNERCPWCGEQIKTAR